MWTIRREQISELSSPMLRKADIQLADYARKRFPTVFKSSSDEELRALVAKLRTQAKEFGIQREDNIATFLDFTVMYGEDFHKAHWAADILGSSVLHGPDKMAVLSHRVRLS